MFEKVQIGVGQWFIFLYANVVIQLLRKVGSPVPPGGPQKIDSVNKIRVVVPHVLLTDIHKQLGCNATFNQVVAVMRQSVL